MDFRKSDSCILSLNRKCFYYYSKRKCDEFSEIFVLEKIFSFLGTHELLRNSLIYK
jgi:hypothetical protein